MRLAYEDVLAPWKGAEPDVAIVKQAQSSRRCVEPLSHGHPEFERLLPAT